MFVSQPPKPKKLKSQPKILPLFASVFGLASPEQLDESRLTSTGKFNEPLSFKGLPGLEFELIIIPSSLKYPLLSHESERAFRSGCSQISPRIDSGTNSRAQPVPRTLSASIPCSRATYLKISKLSFSCSLRLTAVSTD